MHVVVSQHFDMSGVKENASRLQQVIDEIDSAAIEFTLPVGEQMGSCADYHLVPNWNDIPAERVTEMFFRHWYGE